VIRFQVGVFLVGKIQVGLVLASKVKHPGHLSEGVHELSPVGFGSHQHRGGGHLASEVLGCLKLRMDLFDPSFRSKALCIHRPVVSNRQRHVVLAGHRFDGLKVLLPSLAYQITIRCMAMMIFNLWNRKKLC